MMMWYSGDDPEVRANDAVVCRCKDIEQTEPIYYWASLWFARNSVSVSMSFCIVNWLYLIFEAARPELCMVIEGSVKGEQ